MKTFGRVDILVLNSGLMGSKTLSELDESFYDTHFDTNVKAPLFLAKAVAPLLPSRAYFITRRFFLLLIFLQSRWTNHLLFI